MQRSNISVAHSSPSGDASAASLPARSGKGGGPPLNLNQLSEDELKALIRKALKILIEKDLDPYLSEFIRKSKRINNG